MNSRDKRLRAREYMQSLPQPSNDDRLRASSERMLKKAEMFERYQQSGRFKAIDGQQIANDLRLTAHKFLADIENGVEGSQLPFEG